MLPTALTTEQFSKIDLRSPLFLEAAKAICIKKGKIPLSLSSATSGSLPVVFVDDKSAFKFFPQLHVEGFQTEVKALQFLAGANSFAPKMLDSGIVDKWHYVQMSKLEGTNLKDLWNNLSFEEQALTCRQVGTELRKIHNLELKKGKFDLASWEDFMIVQKQGCLLRHKKNNLRPDLLDQIPGFLAKVTLPKPSQLSFLHTEVMKDHVFFNRAMGHLRFSGFIDFEPSMIGATEYDFASVGIFLSSGNKQAFRAFCEGYGNLGLASTPEFRKRIMAYTLLHKYSNLNWYLQFMPNANSLDELAELWWAI